MRAIGPTAAWAALALVGAGFVAPQFEDHLGVIVAVAVTGMLAVATAVRRPTTRRVAAALAVIATAAAVGAARSALLDGGLLPALVERGRSVEVEATVVSEPRLTDDRWWAIVRVDRAGDRNVRERAFLRGTGSPPILGSRWVGRALVRPPPEEGFGRFLRRQYVAATLEPIRWEPLAAPNAVIRSTEAVRDRTRRAAVRGLPRAHAGLAVGLVTGDTRLLPREREDAMRETGLMHLVAVSGANVAIVLAGAGGLAGLVGIGARGRRWLLGGTLLWFTVLTRWEPSVLRAAAVAAIALVTGHRGHLVDARHALAVALLVLVLADPGIAGSLGLLLSASAAAGVLVLAPVVRTRLVRVPERLALLVAATVGAQLAVAPVLLVTTGEVPLSSLPANLLAVPAAAIASALATAGALVATASVDAAVPLFALAQPALATVLWAGGRFRWWGSVVSFEEPLPGLAVAAGATWLLVRSARPRRIAAAAAVTLSVAAAVPPSILRPPARTLIVTAIDVGQGDAILVEAPGARVLVDGGPDGRAARWLRRHVRGPLDAVIASHPHADHTDGLPAVLERIGTRSLWVVDVPSDLASVASANAWAERRRIPVVRPTVGQRLDLGSVRIDVLGPPPGRPYRGEDSEPNETSLVLRVTFGARTALLTGDVERSGQRDLRRSHDLRAGYLKVPHHGGATNDPGFLAAVDPAVAVVSAGRDNRYGHPHPDVLAELQRVGSVVRRTDLHGTVRNEVPPTGAEVVALEPSGRPPSLPSAHAGARLPRHLGRRAPPGTCGRGRARRAARGHPGPRGRARRRRDARAPPGAADGVPLRR